MLKLILFEIKKVWNTTFFRILLVALLVFFIAYYVFVYVNTTRVEDEIKPLKEDIQSTEQALAEERIALESAEGSEVEAIEESIEFYENWLADRQSKVELLEEENWNEILQIEIKDTEPQIGTMLYQNETHTYTHPTLFTLETYVAMSKWMQERNITPLLPWDRYFSYMTLYDREVRSTSATDAENIMEYIKENSNKYSSTSIHYLFRLLGLLFSFIGVVFFLFLFGDIVTKEGIGRNGPIHLLQTQPIGRHKIIASKYLTTILVSFFLLISAVVFSVVVGSIFDRFGDWHYPVVIYGEERTFTLMSMGVLIVKAIGMFLLILLFSYSILFLFSILTKRVLVAIGLTLATLFIGIKLSEELVTSGFAHFIPFQYFSVFDVLTNELALTLENFNLTYTNGLISLSIASLILFVVTYVISIVQTKIGN
ncbi:ABC transporter permease [Ornithinibacillus sp. 179-J 7C1 HS]|uniref:ABC transporter permease n=1 Tax=Ornithinibacillus sp. 179-J 7C1 HS TaxID=3142384 RepID=UPI0039A15EEB